MKIGPQGTGQLQPALIPRRLVYLRDLLRELVVREIKLRYKRSPVGVGLVAPGSAVTDLVSGEWLRDISIHA